MPITTTRFMPGVWDKEMFERSVKYTMELDQQSEPLKELRAGTIILEGDLKVKVVGWDRNLCVVRFGKKRTQEVTLQRRFMKFRFAREKSHALAS